MTVAVASCVASRVHVIVSTCPRHLGNEINQQRVDGVTESFLELVQQSLWPMTKGTKETRPETKAARP